MHISITCTCRPERGRTPDVVMMIGASKEDDGVTVHLDLSAEDAIKHGELLIEAGKRAEKLKSTDLLSALRRATEDQ